MKNISLFIVLIFFQACAQEPNHGDFTYLAKLPSSLSEISGIVSIDGSTIWAIEDNGNKDDIFKVDQNGKIIKTFDVKGVENDDWEDLAKDDDGNLYIGNFGNNFNERENLSIYKLPNPENEKGDKIDAEKISFHYPEQTKFPPKKSELLYDCEAFFYKDGFLYLITKNRAKPYTGKAFIYKVPAEKGSHTAELIGIFTTCKDQNFCSVTAADISPNGKRIVLLGSGLIWSFTNFSSDDFTKGTVKAIDVRHRTQQESICFLDNNTLLIADEASKNGGRNLYSYNLD
ncbi:hypothetical protein HME9304_01076 [Flagellimonas maritima]|uniref:T9SS C-terminal target domain-containing protein n=1 Tax=Flagellimonas maritima TaxID=1383885 RepID=A0A2Z4LQI5_9FLAO|nr:hypothetical protein [Allomuricauda aurantiaca]AWX44076.1 hypothetical protein HME9304_01076 [Allomuricauda aurantiaca]